MHGRYAAELDDEDSGRGDGDEEEEGGVDAMRRACATLHRSREAEAQRELSIEHHSHRQGLASRLPEAYTTWGNQPTSGSLLQAEAFVARGIVHQA